MRQRVSAWVAGLILIAFGVIIAGNAFNLWNTNMFFRGWWTLFIIIPCVIHIIGHGLGNFSLIGAAVGVLILLNCQGIIIDKEFRKLLVPIILVIIGISIIMKSLFNSMRKVNVTYTNEDCHAATFSGIRYVQPPVKYCGGTLDSVFGSLTLDLRNAIIDENVIINTSAIFGGIDIYVPNNVKVKVSSTSFFGSASNKSRTNAPTGSPIIYINSLCMFGGVDIK